MINLCVSLGDIHHFQDGIGEFSFQFTKKLVSKVDFLKSKGVSVFLHLPSKFIGCFGDEVQYLPYAKKQRYGIFLLKKFAIWHHLNQHINVRPPFFADNKIITVHDLNYFYSKNDDEFLRQHKKHCRRLGYSDGLVAISDYVKNDIISKIGYSKPIKVIHNGVRSLVDLKREPLIDDDHKSNFVFHLSRMAPNKNVEAIISLAERMPEEFFILAGPQSADVDRVRKMVADFNLKNVEIYANITDSQKAWCMANCKAFIFPSLTEGFGLPPVEAMYFGKPVFLSNLTVLPEIGGDAAYYFENFDPENMRDTFLRGMSDYISCSRKEKIISHASSFSWDAAFDSYLKLYLDLLDSRLLSNA